MKQIKLNPKQAKEKGEAGLNQAIATAERVNPDWLDKAYIFFKRWLGGKPKGYIFLIEDFRLRVQILKAVPEPPSHRSYGGISKRALRDKLIKRRGIAVTKSITAHSCFASEWQKV